MSLRYEHKETCSLCAHTCEVHQLTYATARCPASSLKLLHVLGSSLRSQGCLTRPMQLAGLDPIILDVCRLQGYRWA